MVFFLYTWELGSYRFRHASKRPRLGKKLKSLKIIQAIKNLFSGTGLWTFVRLSMRCYKHRFVNNKHPIKGVIQHLDLQLVDSDFKQTVSVPFWHQPIIDKVSILTSILISGPLKWAILCKQFNQIEKWSVDQFETKTSDFVTSVKPFKDQTSVLDIYVKQMRFSQNVDHAQESLNKESQDMWMRLKMLVSCSKDTKTTHFILGIRPKAPFSDWFIEKNSKKHTRWLWNWEVLFQGICPWE